MSKEQSTVKLSLVDLPSMAVTNDEQIMILQISLLTCFHSKLSVQPSGLFHQHSQDLDLVLQLHLPCKYQSSKILKPSNLLIKRHHRGDIFSFTSTNCRNVYNLSSFNLKFLPMVIDGLTVLYSSSQELYACLDQDLNIELYLNQ